MTTTAGTMSHAGGFPPLPPGLIGEELTDDVLRAHGLPRRPPPDAHPQLRRQWNRIMSRPTRLIQAEVEPDPVMTSRHRRRPEFQPQGWGAVVRQQERHTDYAYPATMVYAEWAVPEVVGIAPDGPDLTVGFWIGLDGYEGDGAQVLQAGIAATVKPGWFSTSVEYWAWTEWYTGEYQTPAVQVSNFPVTAGDTVSFLVASEGPGSGTAYLHNSRTGLATSVWIQVPSDVVPTGQTTEWAVEGISEYLPVFEPVTFGNCWGGSLIEGASEYFTLVPGYVTQEIEATLYGASRELTRTAVIDATTAQVTEIALDWS
jgi:Peptidase A4 family